MKGNGDWVAVKVKDIVPFNKAVAVFLEAKRKLFVIQVDVGMGFTLGLSLMGKKHERPLTHDLICNLFVGFGIEMTYCLISEAHDDTYYACLGLVQSNELGKKVVELDARPSDCIVLALMQKKPIYILKELLSQLDDVKELYENLKQRQKDDED